MSKCPFDSINSDDQTAISSLLKESTAQLHIQAEHHPLQQKLIKGQATRSEYAAWLGQMLHIHTALDAALTTAAANTPSVNSLFQPHHRRRELALADLAALGINPSTIIPGPSTRAFAARMSEVGALAPTSLLGALYVIEGSSNGGVFISKAVERALDLAPGTATRAINPHAGSTRDNWGQFKTTIDSLPFTASERAAIVELAGETFKAITSVMDDLASDGQPLLNVQTIASPANH